MARLFGKRLADVALDPALNADYRTRRARFVATCFRATEKIPAQSQTGDCPTCFYKDGKRDKALEFKMQEFSRAQ